MSVMHRSYTGTGGRIYWACHVREPVPDGQGTEDWDKVSCPACRHARFGEPLPHDEDDGWTTEWPTEPGAYWFYGVRYEGASGPKLYFAEVFHGGDGRPVRVVGGAFAYTSEGYIGKWRSVELPTLPKDWRYP